ncbi:hypothetical protein, partial [Mycobacterium kiyosense]
AEAADEAEAADAAETNSPAKVELSKADEPEAAVEAREAARQEARQEAAVEGEETAADVDAESTTTEPARRFFGLHRPKLSEVAAVVAALIVLASLGAGVEMSILHRNAVRERQQVEQYAAAARQGVVTLTSLDFEHAKEGVQRIEEVATGDFKADFLKMADDFTRTVEESKVVAQGSVQATAVERETMTENSAVVLVASTAEITNAAGAKQDPRKYRLIVTLTRDGGQLKMSRVEFVP